ncbi:MAG TPA: hypothetical protein VHQ70_03175 [Syntrophomonadaceae bacterium]|nr:hypothetical protein [Syntrophomonadaceae bacterium]
MEHAFGICGANELDAALAHNARMNFGMSKIRCDIGAYPHYTLETDPTGEHFTWMS